MLKFIRNGVFSLVLLIAGLSAFSCSSASTPLVIWTDRPELVSYVEFFNVTQNKAKAVVVYKNNLPMSLPPSKGEKKPDILVGAFLKNSRIKKNFMELDGILANGMISSSQLYAPLLQYGNVGSKQYLLPVSFNTPVMIFSDKKSASMSGSRLLEFSTLQKISSEYNTMNSHGIYTQMGFAPSWKTEFLYEYAKSHGSGIAEKGNSFAWKEKRLAQVIEDLKKWTSDSNGSTSAEQDFSFKYLYTPEHKQVMSEKCLFAYTTSEKFFSLAPEQTSSIDFRWLSNEGKIYINDEIVTLGVYRKTTNSDRAFDFINWFLSEVTQKNLLERTEQMQLDTVSFGICNGFSSLKSVNEQIFPSYYKNLLGNLPEENAIAFPQTLPNNWKSLKDRVLNPYLADATKTDPSVTLKTIEERLATWKKQYN